MSGAASMSCGAARAFSSSARPPTAGTASRVTCSGKTTQLPKMLLEMGRGKNARIGHTQPRRIAARSVAARIAEELGTELGGVVGCKVRFHDQVGPRTALKLMTDGILLAETQGDRELREYDSIIL